MDKIDLILYILLIVSVVCLVFSIVWTVSSEEYKTDIITECNDKDGDIIEGVTCYEVRECSSKLKFFNNKLCDDLMNPKIYQGAIPEWANETHFRKTGETIKLK